MFGFEKDINSLIDAFAIQANKDRCASFQVFKRLFQLAGYAYIHQAYPGCEHNPEYIQLLYATALDRLDVPSPTAAADSPLWMLHVPTGQETVQAVAATAGRTTMAVAADQRGLTVPGHQQIAPSGDPAQLQGLQMRESQGQFAAAAGEQQTLRLLNGPQRSHAHQQQQADLPDLGNGLGIAPSLGADRVVPVQQATGSAVNQLAEHDAALVQQPEQVEQSSTQLANPQQQQQHMGNANSEAALTDMPLALPDDDMGDDFLNDLLAIFDEAEAAELLPSETAAAPPAGTSSGDGTCPAIQQPPQPSQQQQQQQTPRLIIPTVVKAAAVFMLHCLWETQLARPHVCIYVPLSSLRALQAAAGEFRAAGAAAADALLVLQFLLTQQRLLIGQFRRPREWQPQLPVYLQPTSGTVDLGLGSAAANKAAARPHMNEWRISAVRAAASAARSLLRQVNPHYRQDTPEHREAMFHIKSTLSSLSNYKALQGLCDKYADARRAIFEPLLALRERVQEHQTAKAAALPAPGQQAQQQDNAQEQEEWWQKPKRVSKAKQKVAKKQQKAETPPAPTAAPPAVVPAWERALQKWGAGGSAVNIPELFDRSFGADLQELAGEEAARMLVLLDPEYNPSKLKKRQKQTEGAVDSMAAAWLGQQGNSKKQRRGTPVGGARWQGGYVEDIAAAGILQQSDLQEMQAGAGDVSEAVKGIQVPQQLLQLQVERRQRSMHVAEEWFAAQDAMMAHAGDEGDDMP